MDAGYTTADGVLHGGLLVRVKRGLGLELAGVLLIGSTLAFPRLLSEPQLYAYKPEVVRPVPVPLKCAEYKRTYTDDEWDEVTDTYPPNHEWMDCMGVGHR